MQVHSIISNTISEEALHHGHLSIRFLQDGFALLLEDAQYTPLILNRFSSETMLSQARYIAHCEDWLSKHSLFREFKGEVTVLPGTLAATLIPADLFMEEHRRYYLQQVNQVLDDDVTYSRKIKNRPYHIVYSISAQLDDFVSKFSGSRRVLHEAECMVSVADQINASEHQRGFALVEFQAGQMEMLVIHEDNLILANRYRLKSGDDLVYHVVNSLQQLDYDRSAFPVYFTGAVETYGDSIRLLEKYIRKIIPLPYFIREIDRDAIPANVILSEATKCE